MTEIQEEVIEIIEKELHFGFMEEDELLEEVLDTFLDEDIDPKWIGERVHHMYVERMEEIDEWDPEEANDFDRLANAFDELCDHKIIAIHRAGYTDEDAIEEITEAFKGLAERGVRPKGYVYYHGGHLEKVLDEEKPRLDLVFGAMTKASSQVRGVGNLISETLQRYGLEVRWNGNPGDNIRIIDIDWQKEPDDEDWGIDRAISIISGEDEVEVTDSDDIVDALDIED